MFNLIHYPLTQKDSGKILKKHIETKVILNKIKDNFSGKTTKDLKRVSQELGTEIYKKRLKEAKDILKTVKDKLLEMTEIELDECDLDKLLEEVNFSSVEYHNALVLG